MARPPRLSDAAPQPALPPGWSRCLCGAPVPPPEKGKPGRPRRHCTHTHQSSGGTSKTTCRELSATLAVLEEQLAEFSGYASPQAWLKVRGHLQYLANSRAWNKGVKVTKNDPPA